VPAYYSSLITDFLKTSSTEILGALTTGASKDSHPSIETTQTISWEKQILILKATLLSIANLEKDAGILLEYFIPRRSKRIDAVLLTRNIVFVLEFKNNNIELNSTYKRNDLEQCEDYALDLRDFHKESRNKVIVPILIDTSAGEVFQSAGNLDLVKNVIAVYNKDSLVKEIIRCIATFGSKHAISLHNWDSSAYEPTPTIIEAAQSLYSKHSVRDITTTGADRYNLGRTTQAVLKAVDFAMENKKKVIIFVTGVPGSGKTLVGLNITHDRTIRGKGYNASFLSGNYPLVTVLQQALAIDKAKRENISRQSALRDAQTKVQHVLNFKRHYFNSPLEKPDERIIIFDEAQRAWNKEQMMKKSEKSERYTSSEPELIMDIMDRQKDWCVIIGLVGSGQEIHNGEAGLREWGNTIKTKHNDWVTFCSPQACSDTNATKNQTLFKSIPNQITVFQDLSLHLNTSIRSYKATMLSDWVNALLNNNPQLARKIISQLSEYPLVVTRDLTKAKSWLKQHCRGTRNSGLICSSGAKRLRPLGIETEIDIDVGKWFLSNASDIRSSTFLELPATEFEIQGLERDWICLAWDQNLTRDANGWIYRNFCGSKWKLVQHELKKEYLLNTYRVLLTRGREGLVIFVPQGDSQDITRTPAHYDSIYAYLRCIGIPEL
jgi:hypothetical protein